MLKSPKGICLQLESGKVIAIRASIKSGQQAPGIEQKLGSFSALQDSTQCTSSNIMPKLVPRTDGDVIDISNDDEEDEESKISTNNTNLSGVSNNLQIAKASLLEVPNVSSTNKMASESSLDPLYKEKVVYKPNLVQRKLKMPPPPAPIQDNQPLKPFESGSFLSQPRAPQKWDDHKSVAHSSSTNFFSRDMNGRSKNDLEPFRNG